MWIRKCQDLPTPSRKGKLEDGRYLRYLTSREAQVLLVERSEETGEEKKEISNNWFKVSFIFMLQKKIFCVRMVTSENIHARRGGWGNKKPRDEKNHSSFILPYTGGGCGANELSPCMTRNSTWLEIVLDIPNRKSRYTPHAEIIPTWCSNKRRRLVVPVALETAYM